MVTIIDGRCRRGKVQHGIDGVIEVKRLADVVLNGLEGFVVSEVRDVSRRARHQVVDAGHPPAVGQQSLAEVRP